MRGAELFTWISPLLLTLVTTVALLHVCGTLPPRQLQQSLVARQGRGYRMWWCAWVSCMAVLVAHLAPDITTTIIFQMVTVSVWFSHAVDG